MTPDVAVAQTDAVPTPPVPADRPVPMSREGRDPARHVGSVTGPAREALERIVAEAYRLRDAERDAEFPE